MGPGLYLHCPHFSVVTVSDQVTIFVIGQLEPVGVEFVSESRWGGQNDGEGVMCTLSLSIRAGLEMLWLV